MLWPAINQATPLVERCSNRRPFVLHGLRHKKTLTMKSRMTRRQPTRRAGRVLQVVGKPSATSNTVRDKRGCMYAPHPRMPAANNSRWWRAATGQYACRHLGGRTQRATIPVAFSKTSKCRTPTKKTSWHADAMHACTNACLARGRAGSVATSAAPPKGDAFHSRPLQQPVNNRFARAKASALIAFNFKAQGKRAEFSREPLGMQTPTDLQPPRKRCAASVPPPLKRQPGMHPGEHRSYQCSRRLDSSLQATQQS